MALQIQTSEAWVRARDRYVEDLNEEEQRTYFRASPESLLEDASMAEKAHGTSSTTRTVMAKLQPFVAAIVQYGDAVDVYSSTYSLALAPIWGSIKVLLHIAREFGKYFDKLDDMLARIGDVLPRFRTYERLFSNHERLIEALSIAYLDIITFCTNAKTVFRRGQRSSNVKLQFTVLWLLTKDDLETTSRLTFKLLWKPFDQQFGQQLSDFRQHQKNVEKEAGLANMIESTDARAVVLANQEQLEKRRRKDNRLRILLMLNAVDYEAKHRKLQNLRHAGTGEWFFQQAPYIEWRTPGNSTILCCRGIPGCGKSILTSNLVDNLIGSSPAPAAPTLDVLYYYCDYADQRTLQLDRIIRSALKQMLLNHQIPEPIETQLLQVYAGGTRSPAEHALISIFYSVVALHPELYIVFDGLDECEKAVSQAMINVFKHMITIAQSNVKIFITCVDEGFVAHHLTETTYVQLSPAATIEDIHAYVTSFVGSKIESGDLRVRNYQLKEHIISELTSKANGMFLWIFFQLQDLCESPSDAAIRETLRNLPEGLGQTYKRLLSKIKESRSQASLARKVFKWATVAKRPLHVEELKEAVSIGPSDRAWDEENFPHEDLMFESCRGLVIKDEDDRTVHFAHYTVRQYLTGGLSTKVDPQFEITSEEADNLAAQICVTYLSFSDFDTQITSNKLMAKLETEGVLESGGPLWIPSVLGIRRPLFDIPYRLLRGDPAVRTSDRDYWKYLKPESKSWSPSKDLEEKYQLLSYAIEYWEPHSRRCISSIRGFESLALFKTLAFDFRPWGSNKHFGPYGCVGCPSPTAVDPVAKDLPYLSMVHYAAEVGNLMLLKERFLPALVLERYIYHERHHQETLLIACRHNRVDIVECLIQQGQYEISDGRAVNTAAAAGHAEVLQYLIGLGQYPIKQQGDAPLLLATENGHPAVVEVLLKSGADLNEYDEQTRCAIIESAAANGHDSIIRTLSRSEVERSVRPFRTTALHLAVANGHVAATRALLESGMTIRTIDPQGRSALHIAAESGHITLLRILFRYRREDMVYKEDNYCETPFHLAAKGGHVNVLQFFDQMYPIANLPANSSGHTPLHSAAAGSHDEVIRWLVEKGADVNAKSSQGTTPLKYAVDLGNETAMRVLLELGAKATDPGGRGVDYNILIYAIDNPNLPVLRMLLENIREDQLVTPRWKLAAVIKALDHSRAKRSERATEVLEQEWNYYYYY